MAKPAFTSVDDYLSAQPDDAKPVLERVRAAIRKALPRADEGISYQIPAYKADGAYVIYFAGWKKHYSLYPASPELVAAFADQLARYDVEKATIRFPLALPVPGKLIADIARFRVKEAGARAERKSKGAGLQ